jgi:glycerol-3-phosphate dehydrogenase
MRTNAGEFSYRSRRAALARLKSEKFDLLVIGGGITGAAVARDAASRGLTVALVDKNDFAFGTSSRSSKLIHGGLRYLENYEFGLVFESLAERALLLKLVPNMVKPIPFYLPVYKGDKNGRSILGLGMWAYDVLSLFRTPEFHKSLSASQTLKTVPGLRGEGLQGAFRYSDASMWDDVLTIETLRSAHDRGAAVANYTEAVSPIWRDERVAGFRIRDCESGDQFDVMAHKTIICAGPWTDLLGKTLSPKWKPWLAPSRGVHIVFDLKKLPVPGAVVMTNREDGRISFVIPRPDFGTGVAMVGTTDGPSNPQPDKTKIEPEDIRYLMNLLKLYFPSVTLTTSDILSAFVGVRPLVGPGAGKAIEAPSADIQPDKLNLQTVSREQHIGEGPGGTVVVAGGKYTTHRHMAEQIVNFALRSWRSEAKSGKIPPVSPKITASNTKEAINLRATHEAMDECRSKAASLGIAVPEDLFSRYSAEALDIMEIECSTPGLRIKDPDGFPSLASQLRYCIRNGMVMHLEDFYFRRTALFVARADHGRPWAEHLSKIWAEEMNLSADSAKAEQERLITELDKHEEWRAKGTASFSKGTASF